MKKLILYKLLIFFSLTSFSQNNTGVATYGVKRIETKLTKETIGLKKMIQMLDKGLEVLEFKLIFNNKESLYSYVEKMKIDGDLGLDLALITAGGKGSNYINIQTKESLKEVSIEEEHFLIKNNFNDLQWQLLDITKVIGKYLCNKAVTEINIEKKEGVFVKEKITAWYAPTIPVSFGPNGFYGLPGLIMELHKPKKIIFIKKIDFIASEKLKIDKPAKGKLVTKKEFDEINKKMTNSLKLKF